MGSGAAKVLSESNIPVLSVPEKYISAPVKDIVFTTNFEDADRYAFMFLFELPGHLDALVTIVNLMNPHAQNRKEIEKNIESYGYALRREYNDAKMQFKQLRAIYITETVENLHKEVSYGLMVIVVRRKLSWSTEFSNKVLPKKMAYVTKLLVLIILEKE